ncbi:hypothetical protein [Streptomyces sp. AC1-42T]|uniref:hypothetical protein n=1 Tax=Streptomyces sp. AC1-42T TaxID=2218665 RepID=UPI000DADDF4F|nr:hypothetical protein [Streptomyces sp. AC1-42T]PZT71421.1 hypothetical protein DNK55_32425 [Streptomyces sp. AC1-42T]
MTNTREPLTAGLLRAALDGVSPRTPVQVPIPLSTMDGGEGYHWAPALGVRVIVDDSVEIAFDEPDEWGQQAAASRQEHRRALQASGAYLAATRPGVRKAMAEVISARLPEHDGDGALLDALTAAVAGASLEFMERADR